jgi:hypothetical protein
MRTFWRILKWGTILLFVMFLLALSGASFLIEIPFRLAFGWIGFLRDNLATMRLNLLLITEALVSVALLAAGGHWFARWLYREMVPDAPGPWRPGWTVAGLGGVLLLFVAGIATIGITHQAAWLFTAKGPLLQDSFTDRARVTEAMLAATDARNAVAEAYARTGKLPASAGEANWSPPAPRKAAKAIALGQGGVVSVEIDERIAGGGIITLTPAVEGAALTWKCRASLPKRVLPSQCRE